MTPPQTLDQLGGCRDLPVVMLLSLLLLNFQSEPGAEDPLGRNRNNSWYLFIQFLFSITAGRAKKEIAKTEKQEATIFPIQVLGTVSPYPMVVTVI